MARPHPYDADKILRRMIEDSESDWPDRILRSMWRIGHTRHGLSEAETKALACASHGLTAEMAGELLVKEPETIKSQLAAARMKLRAKNTVHAVAIALREGYIT